MKILYVEDSPTWIDKLSAAIGDDHQLVVARNMPDAVKAVEEHQPFDFVVLDAHIPGSTNDTSYAGVRSLRYAAAKHGCFLSAMDDPRDSTNCTPWISKLAPNCIDQVVKLLHTA